MASDPIYDPLRRFPALDLKGLKMARVMMKAMQRAQPRKTSPAVTFEDRVIARPHRSIPVRIYRPVGVERPGVLLFFHGGGFVVGDLDTEHPRGVDYAELGGVVVVSVDYRLAPENPFPAAHDDAWSILEWVLEGGLGEGVDPGRLGVAGGSAGACLAAGLALRDRDEARGAISFSLLMQPVVDHLGTHPSAQAFNDTPFLRAKDLPKAWGAYLPRPPSMPRLSYAAPLYAQTYSGLAPTFVVVGEDDPSRDEALAMALRMVDDGVEVELHFFPGAPHGFEMVETAPATLTALQLRGSALRRALGRPTARA